MIPTSSPNLIREKRVDYCSDDEADRRIVSDARKKQKTLMGEAWMWILPRRNKNKR